MRKLIYVSVYMIIFSSVVLAESIADIVVGGVVSAVVWYAGYHFHKMQQNVDEVSKFMQAYTEKYNGLDRDVRRLEKEMVHLEDDLKTQITNLNIKIDKLIQEIKFDRA